MPVPVDFTPLYEGYALYTPSLQSPYAQYALREDRAGLPSGGLDPVDLDFLSGDSAYWTCKSTLYSAGQFRSAVLPPHDMVARNAGPETFVLGDSGGFQIAKGTLPTIKHILGLKQDPVAIMKSWKRDDEPIDTILRWLDLNCNVGMTLDIPLWAANGRNPSSPFAKFSPKQLIALNVHNLEYFQANRGAGANMPVKLLNVLHDEGNGSGDDWYDAVTAYRFEGWALGGGTKTDLQSKLYWIKRLLKDGLLEDVEVIHILMASPPKDAVRLTAIQRRLREILGSDILITYDSSTPYLIGGRYEQYALKPELTGDIDTWVLRAQQFPQGPHYIDPNRRMGVPGASSPILKAFSVTELHLERDKFVQKYLDQAGQQILINHNLYVYHRAAIDACDLVFHPKKRKPKRIPRELQDDLDLIEQTLK